jgi:UDP-N-acetylglucosamine/UDP-N-acetylgalactosamine diphosphorylase
MLEHVQARAKQFSTTIPVYLMTSPQTDDETRRYLEANQRFGYSADDLHVFCQGTMPAIDAATGRVLLAEKGQIALSPDGHGGMLQALFNSGALENMRARGVQTLFYGQIDNPLLQICHPALIGFHLLQESEMTTQVVRKNDALQRVGNVVVVDGQTIIIEYSDLPEEAARQVNEQGELKLWAGSIAVHVIERSFLERVGAAGEGLPFHRAHKKVAHVDGTGELQNPQENNGIKFERFIFDLLPMAKRALVCEVDPNEGFAALKNSPPAKTETAEWVQQAICALHKRWIREAGGYVAAEAQVEISPFFAVDGRQLAERGAQDIRIESDTYLR